MIWLNSAPSQVWNTVVSNVRSLFYCIKRFRTLAYVEGFYQYKVGPDSSENDGAAQRHDEHGRVDYEQRAYPRVHLCNFGGTRGVRLFYSPHPTSAESASLSHDTTAKKTEQAWYGGRSHKMIANRRLEKCGKSWQLYDPSVASDYLICRLVQIIWRKVSDFDKVIAWNNEEKGGSAADISSCESVNSFVRCGVTLIVNGREGQSRKWISPRAKIGDDIHKVDENSSGKVRVLNSSPTER